MDDAFGGTNFWDALDWVVRVLIPQGSGRRSAVVVMTDGVDNALPDVKGDGSRIPFDTLLESIRNSETLIFPIYLDTEEELASRSSKCCARAQLALISNACGTPMYRANKLSDLRKVYEQVCAI